MKIYIDSDNKLRPMNIDQGFIVGTQGDETRFAILGKADIDTQFDNAITAIHEILTLFDEHTKHQFKPIIYNRAVEAFSLMMDQFYPEAKDLKYGGLTPEQLKEAQDLYLRNQATKE